MKRFCSLALLLLAACGGDDDNSPDDTPDSGPAYVLGNLVFGPEGTTSYVNVLDKLDSPTIDLKKAREFPGAADVWVYNQKIFVTNPEKLTITRYGLKGRELVEEAAISFSNYGITSMGFWLNTFVTEDKAFMLNGAAEYIVWSPKTMEITQVIKLPTFPERPGYRLVPGYSDRAAAWRNGWLFQPLYWTDDSYFRFTPDSRIVVIDTNTSKLVEILEAPCPGLDYVSRDAAGNFFFSSWVYAPGGAVVLDQPSTCAFEVPSDFRAPNVAFKFADLTGGREGGMLHFLPGGGAMFSVFHDERFTVDANTNPSQVTFGPNWRFWSYKNGTAAPIEAFDWNAGAQYTFRVETSNLMLVADGDYSRTRIYDLGSDGTAPTQKFEAPGWSVRLFQAR
ncbi:hypothetical protein [Hyalangium versicolor]|uniref:hypothetical protein n=1 Tax=Hyalangium versicolor TaxID=2861190 RepID=UPI001CCB3EC0|nr:hypothetical protein [Hyalangium versicolor]